MALPRGNGRADGACWECVTGVSPPYWVTPDNEIAAGAVLGRLGQLGEQLGAAIYSVSGYVVHISQLPGTWQEVELSHWLRSILDNDKRPQEIHLLPLQRGKRQALLCFHALASAQNAQRFLDFGKLPGDESAEAAFWAPLRYDPRTSDARCIPPPLPLGERLAQGAAEFIGSAGESADKDAEEPAEPSETEASLPYWVLTPSGRAMHLACLPSHWSEKDVEQWAKGLPGQKRVQTRPALQDGSVLAMLVFETNRAARAALGHLLCCEEGCGAAIYSAEGYVIHVSGLPMVWRQPELTGWLRSLLESDERPDDIQFDLPLQRGKQQALLSFRVRASANRALLVLSVASLPGSESPGAAFWTPPFYDPQTSGY